MSGYEQRQTRALSIVNPMLGNIYGQIKSVDGTCKLRMNHEL